MEASILKLFYFGQTNNSIAISDSLKVGDSLHTLMESTAQADLCCIDADELETYMETHTEKQFLIFIRRLKMCLKAEGKLYIQVANYE